LSQSETIKALTALVAKQALQIDALTSRIDHLETLVITQQVHIKNLEQELSFYKNRKNSGNSHIPPSTSLSKPIRNQSLREKSEKKAGGQQGHEGSTLAFSATPDQIITHTPDYCQFCGIGLEDIVAIPLNRRQVIDIPVPKTICTEHQTFAKTCRCGHINEGEFPVNVNAHVQYGSLIEALTAYLNVRQYMPYNRIQEFYSQIMGLEISQGGIVGLLQHFTVKALPMYQEIKSRVEKATCLGTDETGAKINGKTHWFWTWQNERLTFIIQSPSRGYKTIAETFPDGLPRAVLVHDRWAAHFQCPASGHQICLAHLFRDLNYIEQVHQSTWAASLKTVLKDAIILSKQANYDGLSDSPERNKLEQSLLNLIAQPLPDKDKLAIRLQKKLNKIPHDILRFLHYNHVPADNNGSERAIRTIKVKQKVSGGFRSINGADAFAVIRSVIDTTIKSAQNVFQAITLIANFSPE
jgi:transposase